MAKCQSLALLVTVTFGARFGILGKGLLSNIYLPLNPVAFGRRSYRSGWGAGCEGAVDVAGNFYPSECLWKGPAQQAPVISEHFSSPLSR